MWPDCGLNTQPWNMETCSNQLRYPARLKCSSSTSDHLNSHNIFAQSSKGSVMTEYGGKLASPHTFLSSRWPPLNCFHPLFLIIAKYSQYLSLSLSLRGEERVEGTSVFFILLKLFVKMFICWIVCFLNLMIKVRLTQPEHIGVRESWEWVNEDSRCTLVEVPIFFQVSGTGGTQKPFLSWESSHAICCWTHARPCAPSRLPWGGREEP